MAQKDRIKTWRHNARLSQADMHGIFGIPKRTVENWEMGVNACPEWAERLLIDRLMVLAEAYCEESMRKYAKEQANDEYGDRPRVTWAIKTTNGTDDYLQIYKSMKEAVFARQDMKDGDIICFLADRNGDWFLPDGQGYCATDHESIDLPEEDD